MEIFKYQNEYGSVELELLADYMPVKNLPRMRNAPEEARLSMEDIEKVVLITGNDGTLPTFSYPWLGYGGILKYNSPSTCTYCKVKSLNFISKVDPSEELERTASINSHVITAAFMRGEFN